MMYEQGIVLFKKVDLKRAVDYKAIMMLMLLTMIKTMVLKIMPQFPSKMVMVGVLFQLRGNMKYVLMMHREEEKPDQGGHPKYNPAVFDLSSVRVRKGSRRSIRRAGR